MAITFDQVLVFHKIVQTGSFKSAADELHRTQPAISLAIKKLEEEMQVDLFDRSGYRPVLTPYGHAFYERSISTVRNMMELEALSQSFRNQEEPELSIAIDGISPLPELLHLFKKFGDEHPNTKLNLGFHILSDTEKRVLRQEAQMAVTHFISNPQSLEIVPFSSVTMVPVMSRELFKERKIKVQSDLLKIDQIVVGDQLGGKGQSFGLLDDGKKWRITDNNFKREIIIAGLGWGHLPLHSIARELQEKKLIAIEFEDIHPRELEINLIRHKKYPLGPVGKNLWNKLTKFKKS